MKSLPLNHTYTAMPAPKYRVGMNVRALKPIDHRHALVLAGTPGVVKSVRKFPDGEHAVIQFEDVEAPISTHVDKIVPHSLKH